jgi:3-oxoacyl-[acyl-carrier protein] reductase
VLVTGASSGIGRAVAERLASPHVDLWLTYANDRGGAELTAEASRAAGAKAMVSRLDLRAPASVEALAAEIDSAWPCLNVVVNNGGVCPYTAYDAISVAEWDDVLETNARGTFLMLRAALPLLRAASGDRAIVNVSSVAGQLGGIATGVHYAASKAAILAITRSFARLLANEGIRVNAVTPGAIVSEITNQLDVGARDVLAHAAPLRRLGTPEEVAETVALLASPTSSFTTGATYDVNGGIRID